MSQNANPNPFVLDPGVSPFTAAAIAGPIEQSTEQDTPETGLVALKTRASQVMDDIFGDVERLLQESAALPTQFEFSEPSGSPLLTLTRFTEPGLVPQHPTLPDPLEEDLLAPLDLEVPEPLPAEREKPTSKLFDRILLALAGAALLGTAAVWLLLQTRLQQASAPPTPVPNLAQAPASDPEFMAYLERSLKVIDQKAEIREQTAAVASATSGEMPRVAVAPPGSRSTVLERVYIPVYQPPQAFNVPNVTIPPTVAAQPGVPGQPATVSVPPQVAVGALPPNIAPVTSHVLVGVLELGDRSAALFEIDGTPRRVQIGEAIGTSGWTLVSIRNQEAIVRRNGEVRSIYVGQRF